MNDSIDLYCQILLNKLLSGVPIILFLNKTDLLEKKLKISPLQDHFPNYTGEVDFRKAKSFFKKRFHEQHGVANDSRDTYTHFTQCTDIITMKVVLAAVSAFVLHRAFDGDLL